MAGVDRTLLIIEEKEIQEMRSSVEERNEEGRRLVIRVLSWRVAFYLCLSAHMLSKQKRNITTLPLFFFFPPSVSFV